MSIQQLFLTGKTALVTATGGTITYDGDFAVHTFASSGTFTVTYKATTGLTYELLLVGGGAVGNPGTDTDGGGTDGGAGGGGGNGAPVKTYTALTLDTAPSTAASVTVAPAGNASSQVFWGGFFNYYSTDAGYTQAQGGVAGDPSGNPGLPGANGTSSSITGSAVVYAGGGAGGGSGGNFTTPTGGEGGVSTNGGGNGGAGGNADDPVGDLNGFPGSAATSGYGTGGGGGGGAATDQSNYYSGGAGGSGRSGVIIFRYRYQQ